MNMFQYLVLSYNFEMKASMAIDIALEITARRQKKSKWSRRWFLTRRELGHTRLLREIRYDQPEDYNNFLRINSET